jgi:2-polyprenyl-3-methyl-5-hydroxy-6-metoxy-1,4-benzoquinol methylase
LYRIYRFDVWHVANGYCCRSYKKTLVEKIDELGPRVVVEVGCGLGDIVRNVRSPVRIACDIDPRVIKAARVRALFRGVQFRTGGASAITESEIDVLIMINWIHSVPENALIALIEEFVGRAEYLVLDAIDDDAAASYRFRHDLSFLAGQATLVSSFRVTGEPRTFSIWRPRA